MKRLPLWPGVASLIVVLLAQAAATRAGPTPAEHALVARYGSELGVLASSGALAPAQTAEPLPAPAAQGGAAAPPATQAEAPAPAPPEPTPTPEPTPAPPPTPQPRLKRIFVDAGHGGRDTGAVHQSGGQIDLTEKEANLAVALELAALLRADGYEVELSRSTDSFVIPGASSAVELQRRVDMANRAGADLYVAVHHNGSNNRSLRGTEVYYCAHRPFAAESRRLAELVQEALVRNIRQAGYDAVSRGVKDDAFMGHFAVIGPHIARPSRMPGIIGEALFVSNDADAAALQRHDVRQAIARGYFEGIRAYFGHGG